MMKILILTLTTLALLFSAPLKWETSYAQAVAKAKDTHKDIFVFIEADDCPYCEQMKQEVLETKYIGNALKHFIPLKLDITSKDVKTHFPKAYVTPTNYFITPQGKILEEAVGALTEEFFFWRIDSAEAESKRLKEDKK